MADIQIGKNKYKVTLTILIGAFTVLVSSIGWVLSLQMTVASTEKEIAELKLQLATIKEIEEIVDEVDSPQMEFKINNVFLKFFNPLSNFR